MRTDIMEDYKLSFSGFFINNKRWNGFMQGHISTVLLSNVKITANEAFATKFLNSALLQDYHLRDKSAKIRR